MLARALLIALLSAASAGPAAAARTIDLGDSVQGREIVAVEVAGAHPRAAVLVVGCIHGNEPAGIAIAHALTRARPPSGVALWIVPDLNPDGVAAGTRQNADGVDLNRNFPTRWQPQSGAFASGPRPLSEPEARIAYRLILRVRPAVSIWFHQHENLVDDSSGNRPLEQRFAESVELPVRPLARYGGSAVTWESARFPGTSPFVVELPAGSLSPAAVQSFVHAVLAVQSHLGSTRRLVVSKLDE
jgi:protein MpaA